MALASCKKKDDGPTLSAKAQMVVGTWNTTEVGVDSNRNGAWDAAEHKPAAGSSDALTITFNSDGTGTTTYAALPTSFAMTWSLQNSENDIRIISNAFGADTTVENIVSLSNTEAIVRDLSESPVSYMTLKKQ